MALPDAAHEATSDGIHNTTNNADESHSKHLPRHQPLQAQIDSEICGRATQLPPNEGVARVKLGRASHMQIKLASRMPETLS